MNELGIELQEKLDSLIGKRQSGGLTLEGWRFDLHTINLLEVGLKDSLLGGPYTAPSMKTNTEGEIQLLWKDALYTVGKFDRMVIEEFTRNLELWQKTAYKDPYGAGLVDPYQPPPVPLAQKEAVNLLKGDFNPAFTLLQKGMEKLTGEYETKKVDGRVKIARDDRLVANSLGLWVEYDQTPVEFFLEGDDLFGDYFREKRLPTPEEYERMLTYTGQTLVELKKRIVASGEKEMFIFLPPKVFMAFLEHFLIPNLNGELIENRQSAFNSEDFRKNKRLFREDLSLGVDGRRPYRFSSYRCTGEGVSTGAIDFIHQGRLISPILNLKYAQRMKMAPTPIPIGGAQALIMDLPVQEDFAEVLSELGEALIIHSVLGLHTQDYSAGKFSLTADQCLLVRDGRVQGKVQAVISGDFFAALASKETIFSRFSYEETPGCCFKAHVSQ